MFRTRLILIKGAGDLASGIAHRLHRSGFPVVMTEIAAPLTVRRSVSFAQAVFDGKQMVEGVESRRSRTDKVYDLLHQRVIPILIDPDALAARTLKPTVLIDAIMAKHNTGTTVEDAPLVIALGPGFRCGLDCHVVVETNRGHNLGRAIWRGEAEADTGLPGDLPGVSPKMSRVLRAPIAGHISARFEIGEMVQDASTIATIQSPEGENVEITAPFTGVLRGIIHADVPILKGMKIADLDPRARPEYCRTISDKALAVGGGTLEAILTGLNSGQI